MMMTTFGEFYKNSQEDLVWEFYHNQQSVYGCQKYNDLKVFLRDRYIAYVSDYLDGQLTMDNYYNC